MASKAIGFLNFKFGADLKPFERAMNKAQKGLKKFGKGVVRTGKSLTTGLTLPIVALGAASLKTFADFEQGMLKVKAISGATDAEFKSLTDSAKLLGSTTMFTAAQVAELQLNLSKLGLTPTQINQSTEAVLNLAQATDSDLGQAASVTAKIMNAFGMEATEMTRITDVMADSFSSTALDMTKFETAMASVAPVAKMAGSDLEQTSAILGILVNNGVEASTAGTALRNIFLDLAKSGKTWDQAMGEINSSTEPLAVAMDMFGKRGANVATILAQSGIEIQNLTTDFRDSGGEAQAMADIMDSGVAGSLRKMRSQLEGAAIQLGEKLIPIFEIVINKISRLVTWFSSFSDEKQKSIIKWGLYIAAVGPVLVFFGKLSLGLSAAAGAVKYLGLIFSNLFKIMLANPFLAIGALIVGVVLKLTYFSNAAIKARQEQERLNAVIADRTAEKLSKKDIFEKVKLWKTLTQEQKLNLIEQAKSHKTTLENSKLQTNQQGIHNNKIKELKTEIKSYRNLMDKETTDPLELAKIASAPGMINMLKKEIGNLQKQMSGGKSIKGFNMDIEQMSSLIEDLSVRLNDSKEPLTDIDKVLNDLNNTTQDIPTGVEETKEKFVALNLELAQTKKLNEDLIPKTATKSFEEVSGWITKLTMEQEMFNAGMGMFGDILTSSLDSALSSQENFFQVFIKNIKKAIQSLLIQLAVMTLIQAATGMGGGAFSILNMKGNLAGLLGVTGFAEGGLVTGPTTALIGEGIGTNAGNPEVIAPLDKLKQYMGGGGQQIEVVGKLVGNDIFLSNSKTGTNRMRSV